MAVCRLILTALIVVFLVVLSFFKMLLQIVLHPLSAFRRRPRNDPPECLLDPALGAHEYVTANGLKFHCVTAGETSNPLMLFLHGFPEFWFSWRYQLREFSKDYRVVAVDMRGYGESDRPPERRDYALTNLVQDVSELVAALGHTSCVLVGHDWGGVVAWFVTFTHPQLVDRLVIMNSPHPEIMRAHFSSSFSQVAKSWYVFALQLPWLPELIFRLCDYRKIEEIFLGESTGLVNEAAISPTILEAYKYVFAQPGALTASINYYRCVFRERRACTNISLIETPTLVIWGDNDAYLDAEMADQHTNIGSNVIVRLARPHLE